MNSHYNRIAGKSSERLAALSDGIFGVAMTLLLLEMKFPTREMVHSERQLARAMVAICPQLVISLMSFITLGIFWIGQQTQLNMLTRSDRRLTWIHLGFLFKVTLLPFSTRLLAEFITFRTALLVYWANIFVLGLFLYMSWGSANRSELVREDVTDEIKAAICHRIIYAQIFYALAAALCIFGTYWSIGLIVLLQMNYAFAPGFGRRR